MNLLYSTQKDFLMSECAKRNLTLLYATVVGSVAYGNATKDSDLDIRFVFAAQSEHYLGFGGSDSLNVENNDIFGYELKKWCQLLLTNNPTVLEMLFMEPESIVYKHPAIQRIFEYRDNLLSKKCYMSYIKYAEGQMYKAKSCTKEVVELLLWYEDLLKYNGIDPNSQLSVKQILRDRDLVFPYHYDKSKILELRERGYTLGRLIDEYKNFKQKKFPYSDLGMKRKDYLLKYGYDTKNVSHAFRLSRTCKDIFEKKELKVKRADANYFLDIKTGKYSLEELEKDFAILSSDVKSFYETSDLPEVPNSSDLESMCVEILLEILNGRIR